MCAVGGNQLRMPPDQVAGVEGSLQAGGLPNVLAVDKRHQGASVCTGCMRW